MAVNMNIEIIKGAPQPGRDYDTLVLIDVFRASSTMVCLLANGIQHIDLASTFDDIAALEMEASGSESTVEYFSDTEHDLRTRDNSPLEALQLDTTNVHRAVIVSRNGTKVPSWVNSCNELIVCSFLNLHAVAEHIVSRAPQDVAIIAIGHIRIPEEAEEDNLCAYALQDLLNGNPIDESHYREALKARIEETRKDPNAPQGQRIEIDRAICCGISLFHVVPTINKQGERFSVEESAKSLRGLVDQPSFTAEEARKVGGELRQIHSRPVPDYAKAIEKKQYLYQILWADRDEWVMLAASIRGDVIGDYTYPFREPFGRALYGPKEIDIANVFCELLIASGGSVHKTLNICLAFLEGYGAPYSKELFFRLLVAKVIGDLDALNNLTEYYREQGIRVRQVLEGLGTGAPISPAALIRTVCEKTNNNGKLDGAVSARQEIIYQKREGNEFSVNLTNRCPNACVFCIRDFSPGWKSPKSTESAPILYLATEPDVDEILEAVRSELATRDEKSIQLMKFCGYGEPLLRPEEICEVSKQVKKEYGNVRIQINTTGWPYYKHCLDQGYSLAKFKESGVDVFSVSLNAPNEKLYNLLTRPGVYEVEDTAFARTLDFIGESVEHGFETKATLVALPKLSQDDIRVCNERVNALGATLVVREFVGKVESLSQDTFGTEVEAKLFDIDRDKTREVLVSKGARKLGSGCTEIVIYDIPIEADQRKNIRSIIDVNAPEHRRFHPLMKKLLETAATTDTLADKLGFLRLMKDFSGTHLIFREPTAITSTTKRERELVYDLDSVDNGIALLEGIGLRPIRRQEKCRESYELNDVRYHLDTWPGMKTYMEVEAFDDVAIYRGVTEIEYDPKTMKGEHAENLFRKLGIDPSELRFSDDELMELGLPRR